MKMLKIALLAALIPCAALADDKVKDETDATRCKGGACPTLGCRKVCHPNYLGGPWEVMIRKCTSPPDSGCVVHARVSIPAGRCTRVCGRADEQACVDWHDKDGKLRHDWWFLDKELKKEASSK